MLTTTLHELEENGASCEFIEQLKTSLPEGFDHNTKIPLSYISKVFGLKIALGALETQDKKYSEEFTKKLTEDALILSGKLNAVLNDIQEYVKQITAYSLAIHNRNCEASNTTSSSLASHCAAKASDSYMVIVNNAQKILKSINFLNSFCEDGEYGHQKKTYLEIVEKNEPN